MTKTTDSATDRTAGTTPPAPRVFISYSHDDDDAHLARVAKLAKRLRNNGIDATIDRYIVQPSEGWTVWMERHLRESDFVLVVCTPGYLRHWRKEETGTRGRGVAYEGNIARAILHRAKAHNESLIPVYFGAADRETVPLDLHDWNSYDLTDPTTHAALLRHIFDQPEVERPPLGDQPTLWQQTPGDLDGLLAPGILPLPAHPSPATLLIARFGVVPFAHREAELAALDTWADTDEPVSVQLIHGPGGMGKTRLARHWAEQRREAGWHAGFLRDAETVTDEDTPLVPKWAAAALNARAPTAVIIDYAESRRWLAGFLHALAQDGARPAAKVRVLLLARNRGDWWEALKASDADRVRWLVEHTMPMHLGPLVVRSADMQETETVRAARAFADHLKRPAPDRVPLPSMRRRERVLYLHMAALNAVLGGAASQEDAASGDAADGDPLRDSILTHERRFWLRHNGLPLETKDAPLVRALDRLMAAATLLDGVSNAKHARALLGDLGANAGRVRAAAATAHTLYATPASYIGRLEPDILGEWLVYRVLADPLELDPLLEPWLGQADADALTHAFTVLGRVEVDRPDAGAWCEEALRADLSRRADAALRAALALGADTADGRLGLRIACVFQQAPDMRSLAARTAAVLPSPDRTVSLRELGFWAHSLLLSTLPADIDPKKRAAHCGTSALWAAAVGEHQASLSLVREAVDILRELHQPDDPEVADLLGTALNNLSIGLQHAGQPKEALDASIEAVSLRRSLNRMRPGTGLATLASALNNLCVRYSAVGRSSEALTAAEEAEHIRRLLAESGREENLGDWAGSLSNVGNVLNQLGRTVEAIGWTLKSVTVRRELCERRPDAYLPSLAASINNLALFLHKAGRFDEALTLSAEALSIYRALSASRPSAFDRWLSTCLYGHAEILSTLGENAGSVAHYREGLEKLVPLYEVAPKAHGTLLKALLDGCLHAVGDGPEPAWLTRYVSRFEQCSAQLGLAR